MSQFGNSGPTRFLRAPPSLAPCTSYEATRDAYLPVLHGAYKQHVRTALWLSLPSQTPNPLVKMHEQTASHFIRKKGNFSTTVCTYICIRTYSRSSSASIRTRSKFAIPQFRTATLSLRSTTVWDCARTTSEKATAHVQHAHTSEQSSSVTIYDQTLRRLSACRGLPKTNLSNKVYPRHSRI